MLTSLQVEDFTAFSSARLDFGSGLNVIIGENGLGKSHLLKLAYAVLAVRAAGPRGGNSRWPTKGFLQRAIAEKLVGVFRPETLGRLTRRQRGRTRARVVLAFGGGSSASAGSASLEQLDFRFATNSQTEVVVEDFPRNWSGEYPIFLPTRELLTLYPTLRGEYGKRHLDIENTWTDTCELMGYPARRGPREQDIARLLGPLETAMGGKVVLDHNNGRFYIRSADGRIEMPLVAEGHRKFAMLAQLIVNGTLLDGGSLFWDEPEANLNPVLAKSAAASLVQICRSGVQTFVATHSLFLLRELEILLGRDNDPQSSNRWFALRPGERPEDGAIVEQGDSPEALTTIAALDASLDQSDRFLSLR